MRPDWRKFPHQWLQKATDLNSTEKLVWLTLNDHQGNNERSWPSQDTLAMEVGISTRTVERTVRTLEQKGYLLKHRTKMFGPQRNNYKVSHPSLDIPSTNPTSVSDTYPTSMSARKPTLVSANSLENSLSNSPRENRGTKIQNQNCNCQTTTPYHEINCSSFGDLAEVNEV